MQSIIELSYYRTLPRAILIGMPIVIAIYLLINISFFVAFSIHEMENVASEAIAIVSFIYIYKYICAVCLCGYGSGHPKSTGLLFF